jgi:ribosome silencing factor RsfS/YbeB/iojap
MAVKRAKTSKRPNSVSKAPAKKAASKKATTKSALGTKAKAKPEAKKKTSKKAVAAPSAKAGSAVVTVVEKALDDMKAVNVKVLDVAQLTDITDTMVIATGNSDRHVRSIADRVVEFAKKAGFRPMGVEGGRDGEWVLVDLQDVIVHIMLPRVREFYRLENLWDVSAARREAVAG